MSKYIYLAVFVRSGIGDNEFWRLHSIERFSLKEPLVEEARLVDRKHLVFGRWELRPGQGNIETALCGSGLHPKGPQYLHILLQKI